MATTRAPATVQIRTASVISETVTRLQDDPGALEVVPQGVLEVGPGEGLAGELAVAREPEPVAGTPVPLPEGLVVVEGVGDVDAVPAREVPPQASGGLEPLCEIGLVVAPLHACRAQGEELRRAQAGMGRVGHAVFPFAGARGAAQPDAGASRAREVEVGAERLMDAP